MRTLAHRAATAGIATFLVLVTALPAEATYPGANGVIGYRCNDGDNEICTVSPLGGGPTQLTINTANDEDPSFNLLGTSIVWMSDQTGNNEIWRMASNGADPTQITSTAGAEYNPSVGPDGRIAFNYDPGHGAQHLWVMRPNGSHRVRITNAHADDDHATWSPNGKWIAFSRNLVSGNEIFKVRPDGTGLVRLTHEPDGSAYAPAWRQDGKRIAYDAGATGMGYDIMTIRPDGSGRRVLVTGTEDSEYPIWSPDGTLLGYVDNLDGDYEVVYISLSVPLYSQLTTNTSMDYQPDWQSLHF